MASKAVRGGHMDTQTYYESDFKNPGTPWPVYGLKT